MCPREEEQESEEGEVARVKIAGYLQTSLLDWPGEVSSVIWTAGCNFRCPFCHNRDLVTGKNSKLVDEKELLEDLKKRKKWVDGLVITGGEPTLQADLPAAMPAGRQGRAGLIEFCRKIKKIGLKIKLDTNGSNPEILERLIKKELIDFVAVDIKASFDQYAVGAGLVPARRKWATMEVARTAQMVINSGLEYEFRTTVVPRIHSEEVLMKMAEEIIVVGNGLKPFRTNWIWQNFRPKNCLDKNWEKERSYSKGEILKIRNKISKKIGLRGW